jgi:hypothetical protein
LQIGSKPGEKVFRSRQGADTFLVCDMENCMLYLYKTVDTMLRPSIEAFAEQQDMPYFWSDSTGMMYVLSEVSQRSFADVDSVMHAQGILENMEVNLEAL